MRTCIGCRRRASPSELIRVVRGADGCLLVGRTRPGRGAWLCAGRTTCLDLAERRGAFARALRAAPRPGAVSDLRAALSGGDRPGRPVGGGPAFDRSRTGG